MGDAPKVDSNQKEVDAKNKFCADFFLIFLASVYTLAMLATVKTSDFFRTQNVSETFWERLRIVRLSTRYIYHSWFKTSQKRSEDVWASSDFMTNSCNRSTENKFFITNFWNRVGISWEQGGNRVGTAHALKLHFFVKRVSMTRQSGVNKLSILYKNKQHYLE